MPSIDPSEYRPDSFYSRGFTLIETMLVLAVAITIVLVGFRQYQSYMFKRDAGVIDGSARILMQALNDYYYENCAISGKLSSGTAVTNNLKSIVTNESQIRDPLNAAAGWSSYSAKLIWNSTDKRWQAQVTYTLPSNIGTEMVDALAAASNVSKVSMSNPAQLIWLQNVSLQGKTLAPDVAPLNSDIDRFAKEQTVKRSYDKFRPANSQDPCSVQEMRK